MKRLVSLLAALFLLAVLPLAGCSRKETASEIDFDAELVGFKDGSRMLLPYGELLDFYENSWVTQSEKALSLDISLILCLIEFEELLPAEQANQYCEPEMADSVFCYRAKIIYDFALEKETDIEILYQQQGSLAYQVQTDPPYHSGNKIVTLLSSETAYGTRGSLYGANTRYDYYEEEGEKVVYRRGVESPEMNAIRKAMPEPEIKRVTTTQKNPAVYGEKFALGDFIAFVRADLEARGLLGSTDQMTDSPDAGSYTDAAGTETTDDGSAESGLPVQSAQDVPATAAGEPVPSPEDEARKEGDAA